MIPSVKVHFVLANELKIKNANTVVVLRCFLTNPLPRKEGRKGWGYVAGSYGVGRATR